MNRYSNRRELYEEELTNNRYNRPNRNELYEEELRYNRPRRNAMNLIEKRRIEKRIPDFEIPGFSGKNPCDKRFRSKREIVKYITEGIVSNPKQKTITRSEMFNMLLKLSESTKEYYEDKEVTLSAFGNILYNYFSKDELCLEVDKSFYGL